MDTHKTITCIGCENIIPIGSKATHLYGKTVDECPDGTNTNEDECSCHCSPTCEPGKTSVPTGDHRDGYYSIGMRNSFNSGAYLYIGNITAKNLSTGIPAGWVYSIKLTSTNHPDDLQLLLEEF